MERKEFGEPVQTATVVGAAYGIHRTTLTQAAKAGVLGRSAYRSGDAWLIKTDHEDFWEWLRAHEYHPRVKGYRKQQAAKAAQQRQLEVMDAIAYPHAPTPFGAWKETIAFEAVEIAGNGCDCLGKCPVVDHAGRSVGKREVHTIVKRTEREATMGWIARRGGRA